MDSPIGSLPVLRFSTVHRRGHSVITVIGEIDIATATDLQTQLCDAVDAVDAVEAVTGEAGRVLVVDLSQVRFMDCCGLTALLRGEAHAHTRGARLRLTAPHPHVRRLLALTGLDRHFEVRPAASAIGSLAVTPGPPDRAHQRSPVLRGTERRTA